MMEEILSIHLTLGPKLFLLGCYPKAHNLRKKAQICLDLCVLLAKTDDSIIMEKCK